MASHSDRLAALGLSLPPVPKPVAAYVPVVRHGDLLFLSGQIPFRDGAVQHPGRVGGPVTREHAQEAAQICTLNAIAAAAEAAGGINKLARVVKLVVYVASEPGFTEQHVVANGASNLIKDVFGEAGLHARAAVGVAELPLNASVEVDVTFALAV